ncbi:MAG: hypothetical protein ACOX3S_02525 [Anaerolineae bacterium]|jgi:hypothetical protein
MTVVSFSGADVHIDGRPTYAGRVFEGYRVEGLLFNVRAVQALFDDANPATRHHWAYPDTGEWDADRNADEFCAALPTWRDHGVLGVTINLQGGGPTYTPDPYRRYVNNAFTSRGALKPDYARRLDRVLARADELGMVVLVGLFYWTQLLHMEGEPAIWRAADAALEHLARSGRRHILIELANEVDVVVDQTPYQRLFGWQTVHEFLLALRERHPGLLYSTSGGGVAPETGRCLPSPQFVAAADYVLIHGNGARPPQIARAVEMIRALPEYQAAPKPIIYNEDSPSLANMEAAWRAGASWGYYDQGWLGQGTDAYSDEAYVDYAVRPRGNRGPFEALSGLQTPPINWGLNTPFKRAFFERVAAITAAPAATEVS